MVARVKTQPDGPEPLAKMYFGRALTNRLQRKQEFIEHSMADLLKEIESRVEAGNLMMIKKMSPFVAEILRMPEFGFTVKLKYRDGNNQSYYLISWCPPGAKEARVDLEHIASLTLAGNMALTSVEVDGE